MASSTALRRVLSLRFYSQPLEFTGDFDGDGAMETVRAITESSGPDGADPCPDGDDTNGCFMGERIVQEPFMNSTGEWWLPAVFESFNGVQVRSEGEIGNLAPNTF